MLNFQISLLLKLVCVLVSKDSSSDVADVAFWWENNQFMSTTTLIVKADGSFDYSHRGCYGYDQTSGKWIMKGDTLILNTIGTLKKISEQQNDLRQVTKLSSSTRDQQGGSKRDLNFKLFDFDGDYTYRIPLLVKDTSFLFFDDKRYLYLANTLRSLDDDGTYDSHTLSKRYFILNKNHN